MLHLLGDFLTIDPPNATAEKTMALLTLVFNRLRVPTAPHKTPGLTVQFQYLGIILDTDRMEARLPDDKLSRIITILDMFKNKHSISKRELLSLLGHLNFASRVIPHGQSFVAYLLSLAASVNNYITVRLNKECLLDIAMWCRFLTEWNGVALFLDREVIKVVDFTLYTDVAATVGYDGFFRNRWFQGRWPAELMLKDDEQLSMAFLELYPIVVSAILWGSEWKGKKIIFCDNEATVHIINKGRSKVQPIMRLMRCLTWCAASGNFIIIAKHILGINNNIADAISRFQVSRFRQLAPIGHWQHTNPASVQCPQM